MKTITRVATKTQELKRKQIELLHKMDDELWALIRDEFPVGANVQYQYGLRWQNGEVVITTGHGRVYVRNLKTGSVRPIDGELLWLMPVDQPQKKD